MDIKVKDSLVGGVINGAINGYIASYHFKGMDSVPMSLNVITNSEVTVWGQAVSLTFGLGIILSLITSKLFLHQLNKSHPQHVQQLQSGFWSNLLPIAVGQAAALFGWFVALAVIWTKYVGEVSVSSSSAVLLVGLFAFIITIAVEVRTKKSIIYKKVNLLEQQQ
ncbi:permeases of the major facilitator superfamily protein [Vibrio cholerae]|uniref:permease n=1 Tax=Vibrio cholerae TaxID=666 RepID=UPI000E0C001F|nr:permease [Vibrio cholerae]EII3727202.1 permease [Vibrio cholerae]MDX5050577.1 permease [Vibrio cholerae]GHY43382.1 permeases of the major facilitator superfamily protein [Vibrio cholerae]